MQARRLAAWLVLAVSSGPACGFFEAGDGPCRADDVACRPLGEGKSAQTADAASTDAAAHDASNDASSDAASRPRDSSADAVVTLAGDGSADASSDAHVPSAACAPPCKDPTPHCDEEHAACVACLAPTDCAGDELCSPEHECVACLADADCKSASAAACSEKHECVPCADASDCMHQGASQLCDAGTCVQCTGSEYAACGKNNKNEQLVCRSSERTCSTTATEHGAGLCEPCVSDAQCAEGQLCVMQTFGSQDVGYFCLWQRGAPVGGAPSACSSVRPFVSASGAISIDATAGEVCELAVTTCPAYAQFRNDVVDCEPTPDAPDDSLCGVAGLADGYCRAYETTANDTVYLCTTPCVTDLDCKTSCNTLVAPNVCKF